MRKKSTSGVTLAELTVATALIGILALVLPRFFTMMTKNFTSVTTNLQAQDQIRVVMSHIHQTLPSARRATVVLSQMPGQPPYSKIDYTTITNEVVSLYQNGSDLLQEKDGKIFTVMKGGIKRVAFAYPTLSDDSKIQVAVTCFGERKVPDPEHLGLATNLIYLEYQ